MEMGSKASINQGLLIDYLTKIKTKGLTIKVFFAHKLISTGLKYIPNECGRHFTISFGKK